MKPNQQQKIQVTDLTLAISEDDRPILREISFSVCEEDSLLILGPSGCGKSTLSLCLNGIYPETIDAVRSGSVLIDGSEVNHFAPGQIATTVGVVFQDFESQFCMTQVEDELAFCLENINCPVEEIDAKIDEALRIVGLQHVRHAAIYELSGGMKQKLALSCVFIMQPEVLILDEPTSNLDPYTTREFVQLVQQLKQQRPFTLLIIEHKIDEWMAVANKLMVINQGGSLAYLGDPRNYFASDTQIMREQGVFTPRVSQMAWHLRDQGLIETEAVLPLTQEELLNSIMPGEEWQATEQLEHHFANQRQRKTGDQPLLVARELSFARKNQPVLEGINISIGNGELIAVVGPNGAGKTTLAMLLAGLLRPAAGTVMLQQQPIEEWSERNLRRQIGFVFQNPEHQFITGSVYEELAYSLKLRELPEDEINDMVTRTLEAFRLFHIQNENPFSISQGQKRRLSVATMLIDEQNLLICDEPTYGQDAYTSWQMMQLLQSRVEEGLSVMMITHDMEIVHRYADRVIVLDQKQVKYDGPVAGLWNQASTLLDQANLLLPASVAISRELLVRSQTDEPMRVPER